MTLQKLFLTLGLFMTFISTATAKIAEPVSSATLTVEGAATHPLMALTPEAIARGRANYEKHDWARQIGNTITGAADVWLERDAEWIKRHTPPKGACFAYGFAGCPECGGKTFYTTNWLPPGCSFDNPGHVDCENGHTLPNEKYPDDGNGYKGPDGRMHYFVGIYNAFAVEKMIIGAYDLAYAYSLTGKGVYADRCAEILDAIADIYPTCTVGSWDYPETPARKNHGRMNRPQYQVGRVLITLSATYDQIFDSSALSEPSVREGMTRRENIEKNMLQDGAWYCYDQSFNFSGLTNGSADYIKGAMVVGVVLGIPEYVRWAVDGPYGIKSMLANNIGRDGTYYETATGYSNYTRSIYRGYAEYLLNYRGSAYPQGVNLYQDQHFRDFMLLLNLKTQIGGGIPSYGDAFPIVEPFDTEERPFDKYDFECLLYLQARAEDAAEKQQYTTLLNWLSGGKPEDHYRSSASSRWLLFHAEPVAQTVNSTSGSELAERILQTDVLGQKGLAMLRAGTGTNAHGALLRFGPSLNHANYDELNFTYHALGRDLTYDLGYGLGSAHVYAGWSKQTASHQLVVVDETTQAAGSAPSGGSLKSLWNGKYTTAVDASAPGTYRALGVEEYARTLFLVSDPETTGSYLVDIFRVTGGKKHDAFTHSLGKDVQFGNAVPGEVTSSSLAGKGMEWGDKVLVDGDIAGVAGKPYWVAPPGNGYGFLMEPQPILPNAKSWWAEWKLPNGGQRVRTWFVEGEGEKALSAWAPGIQPQLPQAQYVVRRRQPTDGSSVFITVWEPYEVEAQISSIEEAITEDGESAWPGVALKVRFKNGREDILYSGNGSDSCTVDGIVISGRLARISLIDGKVAVAEGLALKELDFGKSKSSNSTPARYDGTVASVDAAQGIITVNANLPEDGSLNGLLVSISNPRYSHSTPYRIKSVESSGTQALIHLTENCIIGRGVVTAVNPANKTIVSAVSHEYVRSLPRKGESEFFKGKRIVTATGAASNIKAARVQQPLELTLETVNGLKPGDTFTYEDVQAGDQFEILLPVLLK